MFEIEPITISAEPNNGDTFYITCSRKELKLLEDVVRTKVDHFDYADMLQKLHDAIY